MTFVTGEYPITTPDVDIFSQTQYRVYDCLLAAAFFLCFLIGLPGNCLALTHFIRSKERKLPTLLYITACSIDIVTCVINLPVTVNLMNQRKPGLLGEEVFCWFWYYITSTVQLLSQFVVTVLSVTRAIAIVFPFFKISKRSVMISILAAFFYHSVWTVVFMASGEYYYSTAYAACEFDVGEKLNDDPYYVNYSVWFGLMPLIVFMAMLVVVYNLKTQVQMTASRINFREISITITCFACVFLGCNFLTFLNLILTTYLHYDDKNYLLIYKNKFMYFYSWQICYLFCQEVNAALNPIIYFFRFREFRTWVIGAYRSYVGDRIRVLLSAGGTIFTRALGKPENEDVPLSDSQYNRSRRATV